MKVVALLLVLTLALGALAHSLLPHSHSPNEALTDTIHSALVHEEKQILVASGMGACLGVMLGAFLLRILGNNTRLLAHAYLATAETERHSALRRGTEAYRKFR